MDIEELRALRTRLKAGEYDGADIMSAWLAIDELIERIHIKHNERHKDIFNAGWNSAIEEAAKVVDEKYDFMEPWLEPGEIRALVV